MMIWASAWRTLSVPAEEVLWGARFKPMSSFGLDGRMEMDVNLVDATEAVEA